MKPEDESKLSSALESYNKSLLDKLNEQTKSTNKVYDELKKFNERIDKEKKEQEEQQQKKQEEQQTDQKGIEAILEELQNLSKVTEENGKQTETDEKITNLVTKIEKDYEVYQFQSKVIIFLGIIVVPGILLFLFINNLLKQFIF
jgi:cell division protein FtsN